MNGSAVTLTDDLLINAGAWEVSVTLFQPLEKRPGMRADMIHATASASFIPSVDRQWYVNRVLVKFAEHRRQGLGTRVLKTMQETLRVNPNFEYLLVEPGGYDLPHADQVRFYEKNGFVRDELKGENVYVWRP